MAKSTPAPVDEGGQWEFVEAPAFQEIRGTETEPPFIRPRFGGAFLFGAPKANPAEALRAGRGSEPRYISRGVGVRIERIVSTGQSTPAGKPYNQEHDEWVLLLAGAAGLWIEGEGERDLRPGDHVLIPAHRPHRVT